jgi:uncharacterized membrane protein
MKTLAERLTPEKVEEIIGLWVKSRKAAGLVISDLNMTDLNDFISLFRRAKNSLEDDGLDASKVPVEILRARVLRGAREIFGGRGAVENPHLVHPDAAPPANRKVKVTHEQLRKVVMEVLKESQGQLLLTEQDINELNEAILEGKVGDWIKAKWAQLKPQWEKLKDIVRTSVAENPVSIGIQKMAAGEELADEDKKAMRDALLAAGIFMLPGGSLFVILKHLLKTQGVES